MKRDEFPLWVQQLRNERGKQISQLTAFFLGPQVVLEDFVGDAKGVNIYSLIFLLIKWFFIVKDQVRQLNKLPLVLSMKALEV